MSDEQEFQTVRLDVMKKYASNFEAVLRRNGMTEEADALMEPFNHYGAEYSEMEIHPEWTDNLLREMEIAATGYRGMKGTIASYRAMLLNPAKAKITSVEAFFTGFLKILEKDPIDGWIYSRNKVDQTHEAYLVTRVTYIKESWYGRGRDRERNPPYVMIHTKANTANCGDHSTWKGVEERSWHVSEGALGKTIPQILFDLGIELETPALKADYEAALKLFEAYQPQNAEQFWAKGKAWSVQRDRWSRWEYREQDAWSVGDQSVKVVNDEAMLGRHIQMVDSALFWRRRNVLKGFDRLPLHPYVFCFDLERHENCWVHVLNLEPYVYDLTLRHKIVLPKEHRDLIEVLTTDVDIFAQVGDVIKGKSGGTSILCIGAPGLGKTLTAEVYGEVRKRPLYKVHSGQLGTSAKEVEENLETCLKRAERWNAVMLIDEADVFIRKRGDDVEHNAIVASFLRTLEYFHGLLFMTTNRSDDVDDAILSRMIAVVKYANPTVEEAKAIWKIMATEFKVVLQDSVMDELAQGMKLTGRDIKQMLKLTVRYAARKNVSLDYEAFRICAMFRGQL